jgi:RNA polymerase sigma-70 factor, ECF subfamily
MNSDSKSLLLAQARQGDAKALGQLLEELRPYIRVVVRSVRGGRMRNDNLLDDSDLIQEALMHASRSAQNFRGNTFGEWLAWLRTITVRTTIHSLKAADRSALVASSLKYLVPSAAKAEESPEATAIRHENAARMALALSRLSNDMQQVLLGRLVDNLDHAELAVLLERTPGAVRMLYLRAIRRLREVWQTEFSSFDGGNP